MENNEIQPLFSINIRLTKEEIITCLKKTSKRSVKLSWFQTILLILVILNSVFGFVTDEKKTLSTLGITAAALIVIAIIWLVPPLHVHYIAGQKSNSDSSELKIKVYDDKLVFGELENVSFGYTECKPVFCENLIVLSVGSQVIGIPSRLLNEEEWNLLKEKLADHTETEV